MSFRFLPYKLLISCCLFSAVFLFQNCDVQEMNTQEVQTIENDSLFVKAEQLAGTNLSLAYIYLEKALTSSNEMHIPALRARYQMVKGRILYYHDNYEQSVVLLDSAISYYKDLSTSTYLVKCYMYNAHSNACLGNYPSAIDLSLKAIHINQLSENNSALAANYIFAGKVYLEDGDTGKAFTYYKQAFEITNQDPISLKHANVLSSMGMLYKAQGKIDLAESYIKEAHEIQLKCSNIRHIAFTTLHLAEISIEKRDIEKALKLLSEVENIYIQLEERLGLVNVYSTYARAYQKANHLEHALEFALKGHSLAVEIESLGLMAKTSQQLSDLYQQKGDYESSLYYFNSYHTHQNELISNEKNRLIKNLEANFEIQQKTNANKILRQKNQIKKQQLTLLSVIASALILLLLIAIILFRLKNQNLLHRQKLLSKRKEMAEAKIKIHKSETLILKNNLELKNRELAGKTIELLRQNETLQSLSSKMEQIDNPSCKKEINRIIQQLQINTRENSWSEFHTAFNNVYKDFYDKLFEICPDLSSTEIKIAALLKLNLSTKEIASISYKSESAVKTARSRLRSKLNLSQSDNLLNFLLKI